MQWKRWALWSIFVALAGCTSDSSTHFPGYGPPADQDFSYDGFQVDTTSGTTILDSTRVENPYDLVVSAGRLFVMEQYPPPVLRVFGLGTWQLEAEAGRRGEGPGEVMVPWRLFAAPNGDPWIFDMRQRRIVRYYRIDDSGALVPDEETISLQSGLPIITVKWLTDTTLVAYGFFDDERFALFRADGTLLGHFGGVPDWPEALPVMLRNQHGEVEIAVHPSRGLFVAATRYGSRIEVLDFSGERRALARTPFDFRSGVSFASTREGSGLAWGPDMRIGYIGVVATEDRIFALFSGRTLKLHGRNAAYGRHVHVFDWDGELRRIIYLDADAFKLAVEPDGSAIYTVGVEDTAVRRYDLSSSGPLAGRSGRPPV